MSQITLSQFINSSSILPGSIQSHSKVEDFLREFRQVFGSQEAKNASNVLYAFVCEKKIPRVKSESNVIYIGKTKQNLSSRYLKYAETFRSNENWDFYSHIIAYYGPIRIAYLSIETSKSIEEGETELLKDYFKLHREYPPKNSQRQ
jgi:hypothetical protein